MPYVLPRSQDPDSHEGHFGKERTAYQACLPIVKRSSQSITHGSLLALGLRSSTSDVHQVPPKVELAMASFSQRNNNEISHTHALLQDSFQFKVAQEGEGECLDEITISTVSHVGGNPSPARHF